MLRLILIFLFLCFLPLPEGSGQDTVFYYGVNREPLDHPGGALVQKQVHHPSKTKVRIHTLHWQNGTWKTVRKEKIRRKGPGEQVIWTRTTTIYPSKTVRHLEKATGDKYYFEEYERNRLLRTGYASRLNPMHLADTVREYFSTGQIKSESMYRNNQLVGNKNWLKDGSEYYDDIFFSVDRPPEFSPGQEFFRRYITSNLNASNLDLSQYSDRIVIGWVINRKGEIMGVHQVAGKYSNLSELLVKLIDEMPGEWSTPGLDGEPVRYYMEIPFNFMSDTSPVFDNLEFRGGRLTWD